MLLKDNLGNYYTKKPVPLPQIICIYNIHSINYSDELTNNPLINTLTMASS